ASLRETPIARPVSRKDAKNRKDAKELRTVSVLVGCVSHCYHRSKSSSASPNQRRGGESC
ncbi:MAG TPA: hypothetical protein VLM38_23585, partial [Blastocatellia bacterium]|nr:hypothetical protein [Blastocatellia bacterium]